MSIKDKTEFLDSFFNFIPLPFADAPVEFCMALPRPGVAQEGESGFSIPEAALPQAGRVASGRGFTTEQAEASCRGELVELISSCSWDSEELVTSSYRDLGENAIHPNSILGFSENQYANRDLWNAEHGEYDFVPEKFDELSQVDWVEVKSLDGNKTRFIPAALAYIGYAEKNDPGVFAVADSNGCAAGSSYESAVVSAFLELVERDATGIWWYRQCICPRLDLDSVEYQPAKNLIDWCLDRERSLQVINLTNDLEIPVFASVSANADGSNVYMGFGANFDVHKALGAALTEMLQMELSGQVASLFALNGTGNGVQKPIHKWQDQVSFISQSQLSPVNAGKQSISDIRKFVSIETTRNNICGCLDEINNNQSEAYVLDLVRPEFDAFSARIFVPNFTHYHARFGAMRIVNLQINSGTRGIKSDENFNLTPIMI